MCDYKNQPTCSYDIREFYQGKDILLGIILLSYDAPKGSDEVSFQIGLVNSFNSSTKNFSWKYFFRLTEYPTTFIYLKEFMGIALLNDTKRSQHIAQKLYIKISNNK